MIELGGIFYSIDLEGFTEVLKTAGTKDDDKALETETKTNYGEDGKPIGTTITAREYEKGREIDGPKYDVVRMCLEIILTYNEEVDDTLGADRALASTTIPFKIAFNTLIDYGILKEVESE